MEKSRTPLDKWLLALYLLTHPAISGVNAVVLADVLKVTYKTAWSILHKIRHVISSMDDQSPLAGSVEAMVASYCRPLIGSVLPHPKEHPVVVGLELDPGREGRKVKMKIPNPEWLSISRRNKLNYYGEKWFEESHVASLKVRFIHQPLRFKKEAGALRSLVNRAQAWAAEIFRGIGGKYLQSYLDEFCFRFNYVLQERKPGDAFACLAAACLKFRPTRLRMTCRKNRYEYPIQMAAAW